MTGNGGEEIDLAGGGVVPPDPSGDAIYENNFDKTPARRLIINGRSSIRPMHGRMLPVRVIRR